MPADRPMRDHCSQKSTALAGAPRGGRRIHYTTGPGAMSVAQSAPGGTSVAIGGWGGRAIAVPEGHRVQWWFRGSMGVQLRKAVHPQRAVRFQN